ncbi:MAG: FAD-dependent oxidoreductase [Deltaproteobacteria bacterium]|nr:FAD-dependent oxidoreductase [Deltaproteobacteria bacterium]
MTSSYDVVVIGAGPVGCVAALAHAQRGASVLLLEANPRAAHRLAGEWLHPPAVSILREHGLEPVAEPAYDHGRGFVVFPDDGSDAITLPYRAGSRGFSCEHAVLVGRLRERCDATPNIDHLPYARATAIDGQRVAIERRDGGASNVSAGTIVGAGGRSSVAHAALGIEARSATYSRMAGLLLEDVELPSEGFGHLFLGGPGPVLAYRIDARHVRMCLDVPSHLPFARNKEAALWDGFHAVLPERIRRSFWHALHRGDVSFASNQTRPRVTMGRPGLALVGDGAGHHHPLTALGMTLGFKDAVALAKAHSFAEFETERLRESRVPEMLAVALYEVFADTSDECVALRKAVYELWREDPIERERTMGYLACEQMNPVRFGGSFVKAVTMGARALLAEGLASGNLRHVGRITGELTSRVRWLLAGALRFTEPRPYALSADGAYGAALKASGAKADLLEHPTSARKAAERAANDAAPCRALERGLRSLERQQGPDGSWEGENVWCPLLAAQYAIAARVMGVPLSETRRRRLLIAFEREELPAGGWGLHALSQPYLFVTTLVYVAARLLGVSADAPLLVRARSFIHREGGAVAIPTWGKFWLALVGLYRWEGVNPVLPELWRLPSALPLHPSRYYCHTRLIYLPMACLHGETLRLDSHQMVEELRGELYPNGFDAVDFAQARTSLREAEVVTPPSPPLELAYRALRAFDGHANAERREGLRAELRERIRFELRSTDHTGISPVSGLLDLLALWRNDPSDPDLARGLARFDAWIWEDDDAGLRVAGARSATWDTSFALQSLAAAAPHFDVTGMLERGQSFLRSQQIRVPQTTGYLEQDRLDPTGGFCFAGVWHGWPVSDCTAEAMCALLEAPASSATEDELTAALRFLLTCQNPDGGFGSYEARKSRVPLEWLNPAEMFGDSMTEHSYVECTASSIAALEAYRRRFPGTLRECIATTIARAARSIRRQQRPDGAWSGNWGVHFTYGTMFGIRGLLAGGAAPYDPAIRKACRFLKQHQRRDGGWGEHHTSCLDDTYREHAESQVIHTAWALTALLEARDPDWDALERAAHFLAEKQADDGTWPQQDPAGVFFHTALLDYRSYRFIFPVTALGLFETRRLERLELALRARHRGASSDLRRAPSA